LGAEDVITILEKIEAAKAVTDRPSIIKVRTTIGFGSKSQGTEKVRPAGFVRWEAAVSISGPLGWGCSWPSQVHGAPLGAEDLANVKKLFGFDATQSFFVSEDVRGSNAGGKRRRRWRRPVTAGLVLLHCVTAGVRSVPFARPRWC
jgi:transketolase